MTVDEALALYAKPQTTQDELARMVLAGHELAREVRRLRERCEHPEDFCGCATNRTGEEVTATCEWHTYPTTFAEKANTMAALAALRQRHDLAVLMAWHEGEKWGEAHPLSLCTYRNVAWLASEAKKGLGAWARREP